MPREQINIPARRVVSTPIPGNGLGEHEIGFAWAVDGETLQDGQHWENTPTVFVGWAAQHDVDAGVVMESSMQLTMSVDADEVLRAAAEIERSRKLRDEGAGVPGLDHFMFSTVVLKRPEAQKLIRAGRRARDAVFGADE